MQTPMPARTRAFHVMAKPVGAACNMGCSYCYYLHKQSLLGQEAMPRMSLQVLEEHVRQTLDAHPGPEVVFAWQGGEPTLAGIDFFEHAVVLQQQYRKPWQRVENSLQTNGLLVDADWARFLARHRFLVGLSVDGPRALHDRHRVTRGGTPSFDRVLRASRLLRRHGVPFHALCVVNRDNVRQPLDVYRYIRNEVRPAMLQLIPAYDPLDFEQRPPDAVGTPATPWSVEPQAWGRFLCAVWDEWLRRDYGRFFVDLFEDAASIAVRGVAQRCVSAERCGDCLALEADGSLYSCDHYVYPEYRLGNILATHQSELAALERQRDFGDAKADALAQACRQCPHLALCRGDCPKSRFVAAPGESAGLSYLCAGHRMFFSHIEADLRAITRRVTSRPCSPSA